MNIPKALHSYLKLSGILLILLSTACETIQEIKPDTDEAQTLTAQAYDLEQQGQYVQAAELILKNAQRIAEPARTDLLIHATRLLIHADQLQRARTVLQRLPDAGGDPLLQARISQLQAEILIQQDQAERALELLPVDSALPLPVQALTRELRARAYLLSANYLESARERIAMEPLLFDTDAIERNRQQIWSALNLLSPLMLQQMPVDPPPDTLAGWISLVRISKGLTDSTEDFNERLERWKSAYPQHPASGLVLQNLLAHYRAIKKPEKLALLLPLQGKLAKPAGAIRDGFLAAFYQQLKTGSPTSVRIYDTTSDSSIQALYQQAVSDGAEFIIGPLDKQKVAELASMIDYPVPVLTLNQVDHALLTTNDLFQFGLNPEDEARQVAERASLEGKYRAITLTPQGEWGQRMAKAFSDRFQELGGMILQQGEYDFNSHDFAKPIKNILHIDESEQRYNTLRYALPGTIKFMPRRRQDVDLIFLAAYPQQARQIVPQLRFHHAADVPVFTTSSAYNENQGEQANKDMRGVIICDSAWVLSAADQNDPLKQQLQALWPQEMGLYSRLFALGVDAYRILSQLRWLQGHPSERFEGATGRLSLGEYNRIQRTLQWGRFEDGEIRPLTDMQPKTPPMGPAPIATNP